MPYDIQFPRPCVLCSYFLPLEYCPRATTFSPHVGPVCDLCADHCAEGVRRLMKTPGI